MGRGEEGGAERERLRLGRTAQQMKSGQRAEKPRTGREVKGWKNVGIFVMGAE